MNGRQRLSATILLTTIAALCGCSEVRLLPPRSTPERIAPTLRVTPVVPDHGTVIGIGTDVPATVEEIVRVDEEFKTYQSQRTERQTGSDGHDEWVTVSYSTFTQSASELRHPICVSPCVTALEPGRHILRIRSNEPDGPSSVLSLTVAQSPLAIRYDVAQGKPMSLAGWIAGKALWGVGLAATIIGGLILGVGMAGAKDDDHRLTSGIVGGITAGVGIILFGTGIAIQNGARGELVPGSGSVWSQDQPYRVR